MRATKVRIGLESGRTNVKAQVRASIKAHMR
jgi:hypothetical protein